MNFGIHDGVNIAWKLASVLSFKCSDKILQTYDKERRADGQALLKLSQALTGLYTESNSYSQFLRNNLLVPLYASKQFIQSQAREAQGLSVIYKSALSKTVKKEVDTGCLPFDPLSLFTSAPKSSKAGERFPPMVFDTISPRFMIRTAGFKAVVFKDDGRATAAFATALMQIDFITDAVVVPLKAVDVWNLVGGQKCLLLIRPDGYIGLVSEVLDLGTVTEYFEAL
jgi:FAD binding domain